MKDEALRLALKTLDSIWYSRSHDLDGIAETVIAIHAALEQPEPEPVAWMDATGFVYKIKPQPSAWPEVQPLQPLYTSPPKHEPLTVEQLRKHWQVAKVLDMTDAEIDFSDYVLIARDVEALYGIKGKA